MKSYRKNIDEWQDKEEIFMSPKDSGNEFIERSHVLGVMDDIESDVNDISSMIESVSGIDIIDEIKGKLKELQDKLY